MMVGAEGFEPPTLCSQRIARPFMPVCTQFVVFVLSMGYGSLHPTDTISSKPAPATVSATVSIAPTKRLDHVTSQISVGPIRRTVLTLCSGANRFRKAERG